MQQAPPPKKLVDREQSWSAEHQTSPTPCAFHHQTSTCRHPIGRILTFNMSISSQSTTSNHFRDTFDVQTTQQFFTSFSVPQRYTTHQSNHHPFCMFKSLHVFYFHCPCLAAIHQNTFNTGPVILSF